MGTDEGRAAWGVGDPTAPIRRVLVRPPDESFAVADPELWNYTARPDLGAARAEHAALVSILAGGGAEIVLHDAPQPGRADSVFVFDPVFMTPRGAVVLSMGKELRRGEEAALADRLVSAGVPVIGRVDEGHVEGGDLLRLDRHTVALGLGFRTDTAGAGRLARLLAEQDTELATFDLPCLAGRHACLHLRSLVSLLAPDLAVVFRPLLPVRFWQLLKRRFELVEVPDEELATLAPNVLALAPRRCLMLEGSPVTRGRLEAAGCEVTTYRGDEISLKAEGGPTCLTLPLWRSA
jgi:N-dimethylarginine dimethylaminohydrolase